jgi:hypothetical protein
MIVIAPLAPARRKSRKYRGFSVVVALPPTGRVRPTAEELDANSATKKRFETELTERKGRLKSGPPRDEERLSGTAASLSGEHISGAGFGL